MKNYNEIVGDIVFMEGYRTKDFHENYDGYFANHDFCRVYSSIKLDKAGFYKIDEIVRINESKRNVYAKVSHVYAYDYFHGIGLEEALAVLQRNLFHYFIVPFEHKINSKTVKESHVIAWNNSNGLIVSADTWDNKKRFNTFSITCPLIFDKNKMWHVGVSRYAGITSYSNNHVVIDAEIASNNSNFENIFHMLHDKLESFNDYKEYIPVFSYLNYSQKPDGIDEYEEIKKYVFSKYPPEFLDFLKKHNYPLQ